MYYFPEGGAFYYSTTFASAKTIASLSNASPAVCGVTAHGYSDGAEVLIKSGWDDVNDSVFTVDSLTADTFSLMDQDTTDTGWYYPGAGVGTAQLISGWTEIPQIITIDNSGGDVMYGTVKPLKKRNAISVPIGLNPETLSLTLGHDPANAVYKAMLNIGRSRTPCAFKQTTPGGLTTYGYGYMITSERAKQSAGNANTVPVGISIQGRSISYGA